MRSLFTTIGLLTLVATFSFAQQKSFTEKLDGIKTSSKELTRDASTDGSSVGQAGDMNTSVPLVNVSSRTMSFPLQLHYSSGITVDQQSGPVGLGWVMPVGSIVRDYGAYEPDYTATSNEARMESSSANGLDGWIDPTTGTAVNPYQNLQFLGYNGVHAEAMSTPVSDEYHVNVPGFISNSFWNNGQAGAAHNWAFTDFARCKVNGQAKTFTISQEFSRINELNIENCTNCNNHNYFGTNGSYAAAIGLLPYVKNGYLYLPSDNSGDWIPTDNASIVKYEDFGQFTITDENGTVYVFGRPLRGQKYMFSDDPYWSTRESGLPGANKGNFWKIDYIAEWLLTEIRSVDYADLNENGIADDGDGGDWIRFEYTAPTKWEETVNVGGTADKFDQQVPMYREWSGFSQTDQASSLMREMAYLQKIVTPTQVIDLTISERFEVDQDYYSKPANKNGNEYYYVDRKYSSSGSTGTEKDFDVQFPVETMKYDQITVTSKLIDKNLYPNENLTSKRIVLRYADKGSAQELAVSNYLIRNNDKQEKLISGEEIGKPGNAMNIEQYNDGTNKRGKTTLLGVDFYGSNLSEADKSSYTFEYAYNPSYDEIHKRAIINKFYFPSVRQGYTSATFPEIRPETPFSYTEKRMNCDGINSTTTTHSAISPYEFLIDFAYHEKWYQLSPNDLGNIECWDANPSLITTEVTHPLKPVVDPFGYYFIDNCTQAAQAWSMTKITYPTGGQVSFEYERGQYSKATDSGKWKFGENQVPMIKEYNELAKKRSYVQDDYNKKANYEGFYTGWDKKKNLTATFEVDLPEYIGIRLKSKTVNDRINPSVTTTYSYGTGHMTSLPSSYISSCISGFNSFIMRERRRHEWERGLYSSEMEQADPNFRTDYDEKMPAVAQTNIALDEYLSVHFYETVDQLSADGAKVRANYGSIYNTIDSLYPKYSIFCTRMGGTSAWSNRYVISGNTISRSPVVLKKSEKFQNGQSTAYESVTYTHTRSEVTKKPVKFLYNPELADYTGYPATDPFTSNSVKVFDNTFEVYLPIWCSNGTTCVKPFHYLALGSNEFYLTEPVGTGFLDEWTNTAGTNKGKAFVYLSQSNIEAAFYIPNSTYAAMQYDKWGSYATRVTKEETNYKGMVSKVERTFHTSQYYLQREKKQSTFTSEKYITVYEYAHETYNGITTKFTDHNLLNLRTKTTSYLDSVLSTNALSAEVLTYDYTNFDVPRRLDCYTYETTVDHTTGKFTLPAFNPTGAGWRKVESSTLTYDRTWSVISSQSNQLYKKNVAGNGLNTSKAVFNYPERKFDATYTGFEDFSIRKTIGEWTASSYLEEDWFTNESAIATVTAKTHTSGTFLVCPNSSTFDNGKYHIVTVSSITDLEVGDPVTISFDYNGSTTQFNTEIVSFLPKTALFPSYQAASLNYLVCLNDVAPFPAVDPSGNITNTVITKTAPTYRLSSSYARTGDYSYKLPTIRQSGETAKKTPVRPVKIDQMTIDPACQVSNPGQSCYWDYQASIWLKYDTDVPSSNPTQETVTQQSSDLAADAIYRRGSVNTTNSQGIKIICDVWNAARTQVIQQLVFYPQSVNTAWKQFTVEIPILKGAGQWVDVYVQNELSQIGTPVYNYKSVFADDILIYPKDAKYGYSVSDQYGNPTHIVDNNDVFKETIYDVKGRPIVQRNEYGKTAKELEYFDHVTNWSAQNNHLTERSWVTTSTFNETRYFMDGFGKTKQAMLSDNIRSSRIVSETNVFNSNGQVARSYKPYYLSGYQLGTKYDASYESRTNTLYNSGYAYTEVAYEATPDKGISAIYKPRLDTESPVVSTQSDYVTPAPLTHPYLTVNPTYAAGTLVVHEMIDELGKKTKTYVDNLGRVIMEEHEIGNDHIQNTDGSITIQTTGFDYSRTWFVYDGAGRITNVYDPNGKKTEYFYNSLGLVIKSIIPDQGTSEMRYDKYGQVRFVKNARDFESIQANNYGCDQFKYNKYDKWGRVIECGILTVAPNSLGGSTSNPPFPTAEFFDDYTTINNQDFPTSTQPFVQVHSKNEYLGTRILYSSTATTKQTVYSEHTLNTSNYLYTVGKTDVTSFDFMADGQPAKTTYNYDGLTGSHQLSPVYNDMRRVIGKDYVNSANNTYNFKWLASIDNLGRPTVYNNIYNGVTTQTAKCYYDPLGTLIMTGVGTTGVSTDPHIDYQVIKKDIREQLTSQMSRFFRVGLTYDAGGNITNQYWSNEQFDPAPPSVSSTKVNQYAYTYDKMGRLLGADYKQSTLSYNPFLYFYSASGSFPDDFSCAVNEAALIDFINPIYETFTNNINNSEYVYESEQSIASLQQLQASYVASNIPWAVRTQEGKDRFLDGYLNTCAEKEIDVEAYELYYATILEDADHLDYLKNNNPDKRSLKYTTLLLADFPFIADQDCNPNPAATAYSYLPPFVTPTAATNSTKYDAAYWYTDNGNITTQNRNDSSGVKTVQAYTYGSSLNNRLTGVTWTVGGGTPFTHNYGYDASGNLLNDSRNQVSSITYSAIDNMPAAIANASGTHKYRYFGGERSVKELNATDREYYIDNIVLKQDGVVKSYQTANGIATPTTGTNIEYLYNVKDWQGTNRAVINASGNILNASDCYPYGQKLPGRNAFSSNYEGYRYQFTGHEMDGETGYQYHGARYYNEELGRYMSVDPLAQQYMGWSTYAYVLGDPVRLVDPTGMGTEDWVQRAGSDVWEYDAKVKNGADAINEGYGTDATVVQNGHTIETEDGRYARLMEGRVDYISLTDFKASKGVFEPGRFYHITQNGWEEAGIMFLNAVSAEAAATAEFIVNSELMATNSEQAVLANVWLNCHVRGEMEAQIAQSNYEAERSLTLFGTIYDLSPASAVPSIVENVQEGAYWTAAGVFALEFTPWDEAADVMRANRRAFRQFKKVEGKAGPNMDWHHIVEQNSDNVLRFGVEAIQNSDNLIRLDRDIHRNVTAHYNRSFMGSGFSRNRDFVKSLSINQQREYGLQVLRDCGWTP